MNRLLVALVVVGVAGAAASAATWSAFSGTSGSAGNSFSAGTVHLTDNDAGAAALSLAGARPGDAASGCILVSYGGTLDADLRLHGSVTGDLAAHLVLTVTRGSDLAPSFSSCAAFSADSTDYIGAGAGVLYSGPLSAYPATWDAGIADPDSAWTPGESRSYRLRVQLGADEAAEAKTATATFRWEARNQ